MKTFDKKKLLQIGSDDTHFDQMLVSWHPSLSLPAPLLSQPLPWQPNASWLSNRNTTWSYCISDDDSFNGYSTKLCTNRAESKYLDMNDVMNFFFFLLLFYKTTASFPFLVMRVSITFVENCCTDEEVELIHRYVVLVKVLGSIPWRRQARHWHDNDALNGWAMSSQERRTYSGIIIYLKCYIVKKLYLLSFPNRFCVRNYTTFLPVKSPSDFQGKKLP